MIELKTFKEEVEKMRIAQKRTEDLNALHNNPNAKKNAEAIQQQLEANVDESIRLLNIQLRISPEEISADQNLSNALETSLKGWEAELEVVQKEEVDQAIIDAKTENKSQRLQMLEGREAELKKMIGDAKEKLGVVNTRVKSTAFGDQVNKIVNEAQP